MRPKELDSSWVGMGRGCMVVMVVKDIYCMYCIVRYKYKKPWTAPDMGEATDKPSFWSLCITLILALGREKTVKSTRFQIFLFLIGCWTQLLFPFIGPFIEQLEKLMLWELWKVKSERTSEIICDPTFFTLYKGKAGEESNVLKAAG